MGIAFLNVLTCICLWYAAWGLYASCFWMRGIGYSKHFMLTTGYFLTVAALTTALFWRTLSPALFPLRAWPILTLAAFAVAQTLVFRTFGSSPELRRYVAAYPMREYLMLDMRRLVSKSADIFAQQVFIACIVLSLHAAGLSIWQATLGFFVAFAAVHVPPVAREWGAWPAWTFSGAAIAFSATFPYIILAMPYGFAFTYIVHWSFYMGLALAFKNRVERSGYSVRPAADRPSQVAR